MSAEVLHAGASKYRGWCDECQNGVNVESRKTAEWWARDHNGRFHGGTK